MCFVFRFIGPFDLLFRNAGDFFSPEWLFVFSDGFTFLVFLLSYIFLNVCSSFCCFAVSCYRTVCSDLWTNIFSDGCLFVSAIVLYFGALTYIKL